MERDGGLHPPVHPLYILLGEILVRSGATDKMYSSLALWLGRLPGGLLHTNIGASALFSAVSGSSVSTAATIATVALPSFRKRGFDDDPEGARHHRGRRLARQSHPARHRLHCLCGADQRLVGPALRRCHPADILMVLLFMGTIVVIALLRPGLMGPRDRMSRSPSGSGGSRTSPGRSSSSPSSWARSTRAGRPSRNPRRSPSSWRWSSLQRTGR